MLYMAITLLTALLVHCTISAWPFPFLLNGLWYAQSFKFWKFVLVHHSTSDNIFILWRFLFMAHGTTEGDLLIIILYLGILFIIVELFVLNIFKVLCDLFQVFLFILLLSFSPLLHWCFPPNLPYHWAVPALLLALQLQRGKVSLGLSSHSCRVGCTGQPYDLLCHICSMLSLEGTSGVVLPCHKLGSDGP